ncbi:hypothetical protein WH47_01907 [Habropoda laboriosa]|uniref:Uncharacterized protein n=1 Tax=Habropoda laboriosa TaxID=597456 RepID=A0A0L7QXS5_9HYME|nr:PREDICTED: uncharacterized protein LOC108574046 [Habropoda laboriosa]XP_017792041.1 PREDICTED: uncharacterized protein LOC108574046 [Habropoda laboriosa]XP_017792042.1 PREDICTED: uncharacterized protein LOC108574046 [Habropoda laboriosa]KOC63418.1 hypothetical protein WH47_01907 [Habropoda laboriosa]
MGTMRNNFAAVFVPLILMLSTSQSLPVHGHGNSSKRNSLPDTLTPEERSTPPTIHKCLFIDPALPICDEKWMLSSEEDTSNEQLTPRGIVRRSRRNVDVSTMDVIVYTVEGCLPIRLPFSMPSCNGISLDRIVDVEKFRPFMVKGVTKPPLVFPEFNYPRWLRMMTRPRNHVSSKTRDGKQYSHAKKTYVEKPAQGRTEELINEATMKETIPKAIADSKKNSKGSSPSKFILNLKSVDFPGRTEAEELSSTENIESPVLSSTVASPRIPSILQLRRKTGSAETQGFRQLSPPAISNSPLYTMERNMYQQSLYKEPSNGLETGNSNKYPQFIPPLFTEENEGIMDNDFLASIGFLNSHRRRREVGSPPSMQEISEDSKMRGIAGKSIVRPWKRLYNRGDRSFRYSITFDKKSKQLKSFNFEEKGIAATGSTPTLAIPPSSTETSVTDVDARSSRRLTPGKKTQNHVELQPVDKEPPVVARTEERAPIEKLV